MIRIRISSRPASMPRISSHLALSETTSKVQQGPIRGPRAGPDAAQRGGGSAHRLE